MKILFLGTSDGKPDAHRYMSSALLEINGALYLVDAGAPVADLIKRYGYENYNSLRAVFITHKHSDHTYGLLPLVNLCSWCYTDTAFSVLCPSQKMVDLFTDFLREDGSYAQDRLPFTEYQAGRIYQDENVEIFAVPTDHCVHENAPAYGFLIKAEGKTLYFSGDMAGDLHDFPTFLYEQPLDFAVFECAHCSPEDLLEKLAPLTVKNLYINHIYPLDKIAVLEAGKDRVPPLKIAKDGDEIVL